MSFQQVILIGNLGSEPEMRYIGDGTPVTSFSLATNKRYTNKQGQQVDATVWWRCTAWRGRAETIAQYVHKGQQLMVIGEVKQPEVWVGADGDPRASLELTVNQFTFIGNRREAQAAGVATATANNGSAAPPVADEDIPF